MSNGMTDAEIEFVEKLGLIAQASGISRIAGRIWGALIVSDVPMTAEQLSERLKVSRASISTNTRFLESLAILQRKAVPGERLVYFAIRDNPYAAMIDHQIKQLTATIETVKDSRLKMESDVTRARLQELEDFYKTTRQAHTTVLQTMKQGGTE